MLASVSYPDTNQFHVSTARSPTRPQTHLHKHPADVRVHHATALFNSEKVYLRSKLVVIHLLMVVHRGDGGSSEGSGGGMLTGSEALAPAPVQAAL